MMGCSNGKRSILALALITLGAILLIWVIPLWVWLALIGAVLIAVGIVILTRK